jgi:hypothetical protein
MAVRGVSEGLDALLKVKTVFWRWPCPSCRGGGVVGSWKFSGPSAAGVYFEC